jgi:hypothetical protein
MIIIVIYMDLIVQLIIHLLLNPFIAYLLLAKDYPDPMFIEKFFLLFRGFVGPLKDLVQVYLICMMIRINI